MSRVERALKIYRENVENLKQIGREWGLSEEEIDHIMNEAVRYIERRYSQRPDVTFLDKLKTALWRRRSFVSKAIICIFILMLSGYSLSFHKPTHNFVERNIQEVIYPFMKCYRRLTLPLVKIFPSVTELYDESCLIENPYFQVSNMDCWPCENVRFIPNLTNAKSNYHVGLPFIMKVQDPVVTFEELKKVYRENEDIFNTHAYKIQSSNLMWNNIKDVMTSNLQRKPSDLKDYHIAWRINRMEPGRLLRPILKPPKDVPNYASSIGIERYVLIDEAKALPYQLPNTEGANVFIKQVHGDRLIFFEPTTECIHTCRRLSVLLKEQHILWYNWWYWKPKSLPILNSTQISIALMGSTA